MNKIQQLLTKRESEKFNQLYHYVNRVKNQISASASSICIIHKSEIIAEWYEGINPLSLRKVNEKTRYNVFSVRKSYIGLAVALLIYEGKISSLDEAVSTYLGKNERYNGMTIRHLVTHTHGLDDNQQRNTKLFPAGTVWKYNNAGLSLLYSIILKVSGSTVNEILTEHVFNPLHLNETGWESEHGPDLLADVNERNEPNIRLEDDTGFERNLFVSARDLAYWGYLHLKRGRIREEQIIPEAIVDMTTAVQTPETLKHGPQNGFFWFRNENNFELSEMGEELPAGSFQILGASGCACLVIPEYDTVAVRMYNKIGNPSGYDYLREINNFGNEVCTVIAKK